MFYEDSNKTLDPVVSSSQNVSNWMQEQNISIDSSLIYSDYWVVVAWYLQTNVFSMPFFFDDGYFDHELQKYKVDYYLTNKTLQLPSSEEEFKSQGLKVLHRISREEKTEGFYIGRSWENYLESLLDFKTYLFHGETHIRQASTYVDDYTVEDLNSYEYVALFNFKWHDFDTMESILYSYVSSGGTLIIDCSHNLDDSVYSLNNEHFLTMFIDRVGLDGNEEVLFSNTTEPYSLSPFVYGSNLWYGASYSTVAQEISDITTYATLDEYPLAIIETVGDGKILWLGHNFVFHTFLSDNDSEKKFLQYLFEESLIR